MTNANVEPVKCCKGGAVFSCNSEEFDEKGESFGETWSFQCGVCLRETPKYKTKNRARRKWNKMMEVKNE